MSERKSLELITDNILSPPLSRRAFTRGAGTIAMGFAGATALGSVASLVGSPARAANFKGTRPYKIGFVGPFTGPVAPEGTGMKQGFDLGLEAINAAGGIGGHPVEVVVQDDQGAPPMTGTVIKKFVQEEKVDLILGTITSDEETVASSLGTSFGIPVVFIEAGFWVPFCNSTSVLMGESSFDLLAPLIPFMAKKFGKKWMLIGTDFEFPHQYLGVAKKYLADAGCSVVGELYAPFGTPDYSSMIAKIKSAAPDVTLSGVVGGEAIAFCKQALSLGLLPSAHVTGVMLQPDFYPAMGGAVDGQYACVRYSEELKNPDNEQFIAAYKKKYGPGAISLVASTAYYSLRFIKAAVDKAETYDPKKVFQAFKGLEAKTVVSDKPLKIDPVTLAVKYPMYIAQIQPGGLFKIVENVGTVSGGLKC
jgi:ABC-type branched-subunit amino acid transport system substrate-binding protein